MPATVDAQDWLTKQVLIQRNIVTYRSLSRELSLHVDAARKELLSFYEQNNNGPERAYATYIVSGEIEPSMDDVDMEDDEEGLNVFDSDPIPRWEVALVSEERLEECKAKFLEVSGVSIHSLSPAQLLDPDLLSSPLESVRKHDASKEGSDPAKAASLGRLTGKHIKLGKPVKFTAPHVSPPKGLKGKEKATDAAPEHATSSTKAQPKAAPAKLQPKDAKAEAGTKPVARAGTLNFSSAKTKEQKDTKVKEEPKKTMFFKSDSAPTKLKSKAKVDSDEEALAASTSTKSKPPTQNASATESKGTKESKDTKKPIKNEVSQGSKVRKGAVLPDEEDEDESKPPLSLKRAGKAKAPPAPASAPESDDDEDDDAPVVRRRKPKRKVQTSDDDEELKAMMDIDDDQVERVSRLEVNTSLRMDPETEEERPPTSAEEPMEDMDDEEPLRKTKPLPKKRKPKKVIPLGRNGLKKKRVMKTRMREDEKGYQVTEDYSSYESVDEDEVQEKPKSAPKAASKNTATTKPAEKRKAEDEASESAAAMDTDSKPVPKAKPKPKAKQTNLKPSGQSKLANFFGPPKAKKT